MPFLWSLGYRNLRKSVFGGLWPQNLPRRRAKVTTREKGFGVGNENSRLSPCPAPIPDFFFNHEWLDLFFLNHLLWLLNPHQGRVIQPTRGQNWVSPPPTFDSTSTPRWFFWPKNNSPKCLEKTYNCFQSGRVLFIHLKGVYSSDAGVFFPPWWISWLTCQLGWEFGCPSKTHPLHTYEGNQTRREITNFPPKLCILIEGLFQTRRCENSIIIQNFSIWEICWVWKKLPK